MPLTGLGIRKKPSSSTQIHVKKPSIFEIPANITSWVSGEVDSEVEIGIQEISLSALVIGS